MEDGANNPKIAMTTAAKNLITLLVLLLLGSGFGVWQVQKNGQAKLAAQAAQNETELAAKHQEMQSALASQAEQHQKQIAVMTAEHEKKIAEQEARRAAQMASVYKEFENIFDGNKKTLAYLGELEAKVKAGQAPSKDEAERLAIIATGLGYLQKQYQKPLEQFNELADYFEAQAVLQPEMPRTNFFRRVFSREHRELQKQFYRDEGARLAFEQAQNKFGSAYAAAQKEMSAIKLDTDSLVKKLLAVIQDKEAAKPEDLSPFFDKARQALKTHQDVLKFEPDKLPAAPGVQP